jgi:hypothetical protein
MPGPKGPALGALKEDERRARMRGPGALRQNGIALAKSKTLAVKALEAEAFFAAHRSIKGGTH